jgi:hypothetical protein
VFPPPAIDDSAEFVVGVLMVGVLTDSAEFESGKSTDVLPSAIDDSAEFVVGVLMVGVFTDSAESESMTFLPSAIQLNLDRASRFS